MSLEVTWFAIIAVMLTVYVVLDGFDLGVGIVHLLVARDDAERRATLRAIGPVWDGNEVWLIAASGAMLMAFPTLFARSFSGFYLPLMMVLWLLVGRALAIELRHQIDNDVWKPFWDVVFTGTSTALALFFGVALGGVVRGVPLDADGRFFEPLWTDFRVGQHTGILDWYTLLVGVTAVAVLALHGSLWLVVRVDGRVRARARRLAARLVGPVIAATIAVTAATFWIRASLLDNLRAYPWGAVFPAVSIGGLGTLVWYLRAGNALRAFVGSCTFIAGLLASVAFDMFPYVLPARNAEHGLTLYDAAASDYSLAIALWWWVPGVALAIAYFAYNYRHLAPVSATDDEDH